MKYPKDVIEKYYDYEAKDLVDAGICPTCFDRVTNGRVFGDDSKLKVYEDADIECLFINNPRADGHMIITTKNHYHNMAECPDELNDKIFRFAKQLMIAIKEVFDCESVYLCTMCDGPMNHYHVQLIPRYSFEERGSKNFVKPRMEYNFDAEKFEKIKQKLNFFAKK